MLEQPSTTERFYLDAHAADDDALKAGFAWLLRFAGDLGHSRAAVFVSGLSQVENLGRVLGPHDAKALAKDRELRVGALTIELLIDRGLPVSYAHGPVLAVWVDDKQLDKLDALRAPGLCAVPWSRTGIDGWKSNWNPTDIRTGRTSGNEETITNPVVVAALQSLTARVNLGTGLSHPSDRPAAVQMFKALKKAQESFDPDEVRAWAVRHGWKTAAARELGELAEKVNAGRAIHGGKQKMWRNDVVAVWRADAAGE